MVLPAHALQAVQITLKSVCNEGHLTPEVQSIFRPISSRIAVGSLSNTTCNSLCMQYKQCMLGWRWYVMKGSLLLMSKQFFVLLSPRIAVGSLSNTWYSLRMCYKQCKLRCGRSVMKGTLLHRSNQFFVLFSLWLQQGHGVIPHSTPCACATRSAS
jgi:hypothetical protein